MKYKLVLYNNAVDERDMDISGNFEFYTFGDAHLCATQWSNLGAIYIARLWDGTTWRLYN